PPRVTTNQSMKTHSPTPTRTQPARHTERGASVTTSVLGAGPDRATRVVVRSARSDRSAGRVLRGRFMRESLPPRAPLSSQGARGGLELELVGLRVDERAV